MAITFFGSASNPADNGTNTTSPVVVTPPSSMQAGDLVFVTVCQSSTSGTIAVSATGGQTWTSLTQRNATRNRTRSFWCRFNGTWSANPSFTTVSGANGIARMLVFRPDGGTASTWSVDVAESSATYSAPGSPYTVSITGPTTQVPNVLVIAGWTSADDNTWGTSAGSLYTWTDVSPAQIRNTSGTYQQSQSHSWLLKETAGDSGSVSRNQATLGGDAGTRIVIAFREVMSPTTVPSPLEFTASQLATVESGSAVKVPDIIEMAGSQPAPSFAIGTTVEQAILEGILDTPEPDVFVAKGLTPDALEAGFGQLEPVVIAGAVKVPEPILAAASEPVPVTMAEGLVVPGEISGSVEMLEPQARIAVGPVPEPVAVTADQPEAATLASAVVAPAPISGVSTPASTAAVNIDTIRVQAEQTAEASIVEPIAVGPSTGEVTVTPEPIEATADQPELSLFARCLIFIESAITGLFSPLAPAMAGAVIFVPDHVEVLADLSPPNIFASCVIVPDALDVTAEVAEPTIGGTGNVVPGPILGEFSPAGTPVSVVDSIALPAEVTAEASLVAPELVVPGNVFLVPDPIDGEFAALDVVVSEDKTAEVEPIDGLFELSDLALDIQTSTTVEPEPVEGAFSQPTPTASGIQHITVSASPITGAFSQPTPDVGGSKTVGFEWAIPGYLDFPDPVVHGSAVVEPDAIDGTLEQTELSFKVSTVITPDPLAGTFAVNSPTLILETIAHPEPVGAEAGTIEPVVYIEHIVTVEPDAIDALAEPIDPDIALSEVFTTPDPIEGEFTVDDTLVITGEGLKTLDSITGELALPAPVIYLEFETTVEPEPIDAEATLAEPAPIANALVEADLLEFSASTAEPSISTAGNITVHPDPIASEFALTDNAVVIVDTIIVPAPIDAALDQPEPDVSTALITSVEPEPVTGLFSQATPTVEGGATVEPDPIAGTFNQPAFSLGGTVTVVPDALAGTASQPDPTVLGRANIAVNSIAGAFSIPATPTVSVSVVAVVGELSVTGSLPDTTFAGSKTVSPEPITGTLTPHNPQVNAAAQSVTVSPVPVTGAFTLSSFTSSTDAELVPVEIDAAASQPTPTVALTNSPTVTPAPITGEFGQLTPAVLTNGGVLLAPDAIGGTFSVPAPTLGLGGTVEVEPVAAEASLLEPNVAIGDVASVSVTPSPITGTFDEPAPTPSGTASVTVAPAYIAGATSVEEPSVQLPKTIAVLNLDAVATVGVPSILLNSARVIPDPVTGVVSTVAPFILGTLTPSDYPRVTDIYGTDRIVGRRFDRIQDAEERAGIMDIYIGRR
jgi:hypothetical protein